MDIPSNFPGFKNRPALLISAGKQSGRAFLAENGSVNELLSLEIENPRYSDREGFFVSSGNSRTYGFRSIENKNNEIKRKFVRGFAEKLKNATLGKKIEEVYLFSPDYALPDLKNKLPKKLTGKIRLEIPGNFVKFGPLDLIKRIYKSFENMGRKNYNIRPEETKILSKPKEHPSSLKKRLKLKF